VIYNNAGVGGPEGKVTECSEERYDLISDVNIRGVWLGMKYGIPHIERAGGGSIIVTASIAAITGVAGVSAYCASKGAVVALVQAAAGEWASKNIRINCILPGNIATGQGSRDEEQIEQSREFMARYNPVKRSGEATDIANAALFLASDASSLITGQKLVVDGGWTSLDDRYVQVMGPQYSQA
jgi:NAD(P)-dependent dehydrogenase (short-subunit alcohol dehydrogenase family)